MGENERRTNDMKFRNKIIATTFAGVLVAGGLAGCGMFGGSEETTAVETTATETTAAEETSSEKTRSASATESTSAKTSSGSSSSKESNELDASEMGVAANAAKELNTGNEQYLTGKADMDVSSDLREELTNGQKPHTVVITCSDSRVPPELIFNADLGELFTIRTAGNVVGEYEVGSVEYAVDHLGSQLVLVMGHSSCGAVGAAVEGHAEGNVASIVDEIIPSVEEAEKTEKTEEDIASKAEDLNVENTLARLRESKVIKELENSGKIKLVGAKYDIETGKVSYFSE